MIPLGPKRVVVFLLSAFTALVTWILQGIIGQASYDGLPTLMGFIQKPNAFVSLVKSRPLGFSLLALGILVIPVGILLWRIYGSHNMLSRLCKLDDSLLVHLQQLPQIKGKELSRSRNRVLEDLLRDAVSVLKQMTGNCRICVYMPLSDKTLKIKYSEGFTSESIVRNVYSINSDPTLPHGVVGTAYEKKEVIITHFNKVNGKWVPDRPEYVKLPTRNEKPDYRTFISQPMIGPDERVRGVTCVDSEAPNVFDDRLAQEFILSIAQRIMAAIELSAALGGKHDQEGSITKSTPQRVRTGKQSASRTSGPIAQNNTRKGGEPQSDSSQGGLDPTQ